MNRAYKLVWNTVSNSWIVASELARGRKKSSSSALKLAVLLAGGLASGLAAAAPAANALPTGEQPLAGSIAFDRSTPNQLTINQSTAYAITAWSSFNVGQDAKVVINQPTSTSYSLNQVTSGAASQIFGKVESNGHFILSNTAGITFGAGSQVNAAAIVATANPSVNGSTVSNLYYVDTATAGATVANYGTLSATAGDVTLLAPRVINAGAINATGGSVNLMNADSVLFTNSVPSVNAASSVTGFIQNSGNITATQVSSVGGKILLKGDTSQSNSQIQLAGTLDATTNTGVNGRSIVVNGDVNLNGTSNALDFTSTSGYSLTNAAQLNLNGASSGFSVNGTAYTVIRDVTQLQAMNSNLAGKYVLAANIDASDTVNWNSGAGFVPVGNSSTKFAGILDGLGHSISQLSNDVASGNNGLFGTVTNATVQNLILKDAALKGGTNAGLLIGHASNGNLSVNNVMVNGTLNGGSNTAGGLIGFIQIALTSGAYTTDIRNAYSNVAISNIARSNGGGLIGAVWNQSGSSVTASFNIQNVSSSGVTSGQNAGGVIGAYQVGSITGTTNLTLANAYTDTSVTATSSMYGNGLVGAAFMLGAGAHANISNSYWNMDKAGQSTAIAPAGNSAANVITSQLTGLSDAQSKQLASYANWGNTLDAQAGTGSTWRIYDGQTGPLLRSFLKPLSISIGDMSKTYDGTTYSSIQYQADGIADASKILQSFAGARNAGTYALGNALYSIQNGYDLNVSGGTLTINKRLLTISATDASKVYDGKLTSSDKPTVVGRQRGDAIVGLTQSYADKNAGTGKTINVDAGYTIRDGNNGNNYDVVVVNSTAGVITPKALTISTVASTKVYDGGVTSDNKPLVTGLLSGDRVTGLFQQYETKTVGTGKKLLVKSGYVVQDGNGGNNYTVTEQGSNDGVITTN